MNDWIQEVIDGALVDAGSMFNAMEQEDYIDALYHSAYILGSLNAIDPATLSGKNLEKYGDTKAAAGRISKKVIGILETQGFIRETL